MVGNKSVFWQALIFTLVVFLVGFVFGAFIESYQADKLKGVLSDSEINLLDEQLRGRIAEFNVSCSIESESLFEFADRIYWDASTLEDYDSSSKFSDEFKRIHKRYDLLRFLLWTESIELKKRCGGDFHTIVYFYDYKSEDLEIRARQNVYEKVLENIKDAYPSKILLIPIAVNTELSSIDLVVKGKQINAPSIFIDESIVVEGDIEFGELENRIFNKSQF